MPTVALPDPEDQGRFDSWSNALTGIGEHGFDKREGSQLNVPVLSYQDVIDLWRSDAMAARAIELLPAECFARGYELHIDSDDEDDSFLDDVQDRMSELKIDEIVERAYRYERGFGGAAILMGADDGGAPDEPLIPSKIKSLDWLTVMEPLEIYPASYYQDVNHPKYGEPEYYRQQAFTISGAGTVIGVTDRRAPSPTMQLIHESRLIIFGGRRVSRYQRSQGLMVPLWGDSILMTVIEALRDYNISWASAGLLAVDYAQSVISVENLMSQVAKNADGVRARMQALNLMRSNARMILIDSKEKFQRESTTLTGFPELLDRISQRLAADADIPFSMLVGLSPSGLGQPGQNDIAMFQDRVRSAQRRRLTNPIKFLAKTVMSTLRKRKLPSRWGIEWANLVHQSDKDIVETRLAQMRADSMAVKMGALKPDEVRKSRWRKRRYSFETTVDNGPAPGFIAPLPAGVLPKADPAEGVVKAVEASQAGGDTATKARTGPDAHMVGGYPRRNPRQPALEGVKEGGDKAEARGDAAHMDDRPVVQRKMFAGLPIAIEAPKGSTLEFTNPEDGRTGIVEMQNDYGFIEGVKGADGDSLDCFLGDHEDATDVHVAHIMQPPDFIHHQQDKILLGFKRPEDASAALIANYKHDPRYLGGLSSMSMEAYKTKYLGSGLPAVSSGAGQMDGADATVVVPGMSTAGDREQLEHADYIEKQGDRWHVMSEEGKSLGNYESKKQAVTRLRQVEYFKAHPEKDAVGESSTSFTSAVIGGWLEGQEGAELDRPPGKQPEGDPLWNAPLASVAGEDED